MIRGDLATMSLADLLQWVDATRKSVVIEIERPDGFRAWLRTVDRHVVAASAPPARGALASDGARGTPGPGLRALVVESLLDLFFEDSASFLVREGTSAPSGGVPVDIPIGFLVMEGLRQMDEWPRIEKSYPDDTARVRVLASGEAAELSVIQARILEAAAEAPTLGKLRLVLGMSRRALLRRVDELRSIGLVDVEGSVSAPDLPSKLVDQAMTLVRERQFAEAAHVLRTLLASTPEDARLAGLLREVERRHLAHCYEQVSPSDLVRLAPGPPRQGIGAAERALVDVLTDKPRSVAGLVLVSPLRELETLTHLLQLRKKGIVQIERVG